MRKLIELTRESLVVCDNPDCDFTIPYGFGMDGMLVNYINTPCPKCGENLLTEQDYLLHEKLMKVINWINRWFSWITVFFSKKKLDQGNSFRVHVHKGYKITDKTE